MQGLRGPNIHKYTYAKRQRWPFLCEKKNKNNCEKETEIVLVRDESIVWSSTFDCRFRYCSYDSHFDNVVSGPSHRIFFCGCGSGSIKLVIIDYPLTTQRSAYNDHCPHTTHNPLFSVNAITHISSHIDNNDD